MVKGIPKASKKWAVKDKAVCVDKKLKSIYLKTGEVMWVGKIKGVKGEGVGVEFDVKVDSKDSKEKYTNHFKTKKVGHGAILKAS